MPLPRGLGVSKPFIYANFGSKSELLAEICERGVAIAHEAIDGVTALDLPPAQALELFARRYVATILENQKHIAVYVRKTRTSNPGGAADRCHASRVLRQDPCAA